MSNERVHNPIGAEGNLNALYRKISWRLIPFLFFCYFAAYLDRINVGFAKLQMLTDLQFTEAAFGLGAGLFFIGYILFEIPSNLILEKVGAKVWIARIMITWGILSGLTMFVTTPIQFYLIRFFLGVAEAGFLPGVLYYLTKWYPSYRRGRIIALFMIGLPMSSIVGGPLSGWIMSYMDQARGLAGWQWLFLIEAIPSVLLGILTLWLLPNDYQQAKWLQPEERTQLAKTLNTDAGEVKGEKHGFAEGFFNLKVWKLGGINFSMLLCTYAMGFWLPTFIRNAGINDSFHIGLLVSIPSIAALLGMLVLGASSDHRRERRWHLVIPFIITAAALTTSTFFTENLLLTMILFTLAQIGTVGTIPVFFSLPGTFLKGTAAATGFALAISLASIAGLVSNTLIGLTIDLTGKSEAALWFFSACLLLSCLLVLSLPAKLVNR